MKPTVAQRQAAGLAVAPISATDVRTGQADFANAAGRQRLILIVADAEVDSGRGLTDRTRAVGLFQLIRRRDGSGFRQTVSLLNAASERLFDIYAETFGKGCAAAGNTSQAGEVEAPAFGMIQEIHEHGGNDGHVLNTVPFDGVQYARGIEARKQDGRDAPAVGEVLHQDTVDMGEWKRMQHGARPELGILAESAVEGRGEISVRQNDSLGSAGGS